ncbi:MAG: AI-2E family transporter [Desulfobacterales bacterium]|nr:AI-2E family transporter [Desulfobacterales bacterium]
MGDNNSRNIIFWSFLSLFILSIVMLTWIIRPFISIIILGAVITGLFLPVFNLINVKDKITPAFASFLTCTLIFFVVLVPVVFLVGILSKDAHDLYITAKGALLNDQIKNLVSNSGILETANIMLKNFNIEFTGETLNKAVSEIGKIVGLFLYEQARLIASNTLAFFANIFLMLLVVYFLLIDGNRLISFITDLSPLPKEQDEKLIQKFKDMAGAILIGNGLGGLIQGVLGGTVFMLFGLRSPFLWGVIMAMLAFLPIVGIGAVFIPAAIYLFLKERIAAAIFFVVFYIILSVTVEYILKPKIVGQRVKMHPLLIFFSIIGGLKLFGIVGIIYGPLIATAFLTLTDIYNVSYRKLLGSKELT